MMKKIKETKLLILLCIIGLFFTVPAKSKGIIDYFVDMPAYLLPSLKSSYKLEMVENMLSQKSDTIQNELNTTIRFLELDTVNQYIHLESSENSTFQIFTTTHSNDTIIGIINSVCAPICSSYISFFDVEWKKQNINLPHLQSKDWIEQNDTLINGKKLSEWVITSFIEYKFNPTKKTIEALNHSLDFLGLEDKSTLESYFSDKPITLFWDKPSSSYQIKND